MFSFSYDINCYMNSEETFNEGNICVVIILIFDYQDVI